MSPTEQSNKAVSYKRDKGASKIYQEIIVEGKVYSLLLKTDIFYLSFVFFIKR